MDKRTLLQVVEENHITNAQQFTAFFLNDSSKGFLSPYPKGYGESLWEEKLNLLRTFYAITLPKRKYRKKGQKPNKHHLITSKIKRYGTLENFSEEQR